MRVTLLGAILSVVALPAAANGLVLSDWDARIAGMLERGELVARWRRSDPLVSGRVHERLRQLHRGVPVYGAEVVRQIDEYGRTVSVFATVYEGIDLDPRPALTPEQAIAIVERISGRDLGLSVRPELLILPNKGRYTLCYRLRAITRGDLTMYFVDAHTGAVVHSRSDLLSQGVVGTGVGVYGDRKKMSAIASGGSFIASDELRPPPLQTYDLKGDLEKVLRFLDGERTITQADRAVDADNSWTDGAVVDAHTYAGWTYDYYFKRFGRRGLDNGDLPVFSLVHPVRREDCDLYPAFVISAFYMNAFYIGGGVMLYGEGLPAGITAGGQYYDFTGDLDTVAHELTHGVTDYSSGLIYENESGALNEAFSDIMATGVEFFFFPPGDGLLKADYLFSEDSVRPGGLRSLANPSAFGDPDHYSRRFVGSFDNGGVHINSSIANHAFYLAIEGGTNRTSGLGVEGVGPANREQIEQVFYRAFVFMLPPSANFSTARAATLQAARDLYQPGSAAERAVIQAWAAVGVQ